MLISVILATYNRKHLLPRCIESVLAQDFNDFELIIVDDGSIDHTAHLIKNYSDPRIKYIYAEHRRQAYAKNLGIQFASGTWVTFIDSDDYYLPNHLRSRLEFMQANPHLDLIMGGFETPEKMLVVDYYDPSQMISIESCVVGATFFGRKEVFLKLQGFQSLLYGEDTEFWQRAEKNFSTQKAVLPKTYIYSQDDLSSITQREKQHSCS